jgi:hypothetical protein
MLNMIRQDERLHRLYEILTSIDGIGNHVATELIIFTNEFKNFLRQRSSPAT